MRREFPRVRPVCGVATALAALALSLAGCGASPAAGSASAGATGKAGHPKAASSPDDSLALSHMKVLTKLKQAQLCGLLSPSAAAKTLGGPLEAPVYSSEAHLGITCQWVRKGAAAGGFNELYVGISMTTAWTGAQAVDKLLHASSVTIDGHPALAIARRATLGYAQVDVALGGDHDPVAEYRAPTMIGTLALAKSATPHILAFG